MWVWVRGRHSCPLIDALCLSGCREVSTEAREERREGAGGDVIP